LYSIENRWFGVLKHDLVLSSSIGKMVTSLYYGEGGFMEIGGGV